MLAGFIVFAAPAQAQVPPGCPQPVPGQTTTCTLHASNLPPQTMPVSPNVCPDGSVVPGGSLTISVATEVFHFTVNGAGDVWDTGTSQGTFSFTAFPDGTVYTGHFAMWFGDAINNQNSVSNGTVNFVGTSATGAHLSLHVELHFRISVDGQVTMSFATHC
jgi:hypothetical protein